MQLPTGNLLDNQKLRFNFKISAQIHLGSGPQDLPLEEHCTTPTYPTFPHAHDKNSPLDGEWDYTIPGCLEALIAIPWFDTGLAALNLLSSPGLLYLEQCHTKSWRGSFGAEPHSSWHFAPSSRSHHQTYHFIQREKISWDYRTTCCLPPSSFHCRVGAAPAS